MKDAMNRSEFYHFGILPQLCVHSPIEDQYSNMYIPREKCECGSSEWVDAKMDIVKPVNGYIFPQKEVHRCQECKEVRMADHIGILEK